MRKGKGNVILDKVCFLFFCLLIFVNPLPLGSNRAWAWSLEAMFALSLLLILLSQSVLSKNFLTWQQFYKIKLELFLIILWLVVNFIYIIPLPIPLVSLISPNVASAYSEIGATYGFLSLDVYSSYQTLMLSIYYFTIFILGVVLINSRKRVKIILVLFIALGVVQSIYAMYLVSVDQTGTLVQLNTVSFEHASGTFINKNHLVAFLSMCFIMGLCLRMVLSAKYVNSEHLGFKVRLVRFIGSPLRLLDFSLFLIVAGVWSTHSRAGLASFLLSLAFLSILIFYFVKNNSVSIKKIAFAISIGALLLVILADDVGYLLKILGQNSDDSFEYVMNTAEGRLLAFNQVVANYSSFWFSGVGPGAYQVFFVNHRLVDQSAYFDHAHNDYIEFLIEYGLFSLIMLVLLVVFLYKIFIFVKKSSSRLHQYLGICVVSSIIYMLFHGSMDFNARIPANVFTIILAISMVYGRIIKLNDRKKEN